MPLFDSVILDDFNRANGGLGSNWSAFEDGPVGSIASNAYQINGVLKNQYWNPTQFNPNCEVYITFPNWSALAGNLGSHWLDLRLQNPGTVGADDGYECNLDHVDGKCSILRIVNGAYTSVANVTPSAWQNGDKLGFTADASGATVTLVAYRWRAGVWTLLVSYNDTSADRITTGGYVAFGGSPSGTTSSLDDFGGGNTTGSIFTKPFTFESSYAGR